MVFNVYIDVIFLINLMTNYITLCSTSLITGLPLRRGRFIFSASIGGVYATLIYMFNVLGFVWAKLLVGFLMVLIAFGYKRPIYKFLSFFGVSAVYAGIALALGYLLGETESLSFAYLSISSSVSYLILLFIFKPSAYGIGEKKILPLEITYNGKSVKINALVDTGNTLRDPITNMRAVICDISALEEFFSEDELEIIGRLNEEEAMLSLPKVFRLLPYKTVERRGFMLAFKPDEILINGKRREVLLAISKNKISDGGNYSALVGAGEE